MFARAVTTRLLTYALGRPVEAVDMPQVRELVRQAAQDDYRFSSLIKGIANSEAFRYSVVPGASDDGHMVADN